MATEGSRTTQQLARVFEAVKASGLEHPTAEQVFARVRRVLPRISLGTIYRNLQRLADEEQIGVAPLGHGATRYDPTPTPHDHFLCTKCGRVDDLPSAPPHHSLGVARRAGHAIHGHALLLHGRCRRCRGRRA